MPVGDVVEERSESGTVLLYVLVEMGRTMLRFGLNQDKSWVKKIDSWPTDGRRISCRDDLWVSQMHYKQAATIAFDKFKRAGALKGPETS